MNEIEVRHGYTHSPAKQKVRQATFDRLKKTLFWNEDHFTRDIAFLAGWGDQEFKLWFDAEAFIPGIAKGIGINGPDPASKKSLASRVADSKALLAHNAEVFSEATENGTAEWHHGMFEDALDQDLFPNVAAIILDSHYGIGGWKLFEKLHSPLRATLRAARRHGQALLFLNFNFSGMCETGPRPALQRDRATQRLKNQLAVFLTNHLTRKVVPSDFHFEWYNSHPQGKGFGMIYTIIVIDRAELR